MLAGHVATGLVAGAKFRRPSAGTWILAAVLVDLLVFVFVLTGIEQIEFLDGRGAARYFHPVEISFSHSLAAGLLFGGLFAALLVGAGYPRRIALIGALLVIGHWVLDVVSHPSHMPLAPGLAWRAGFGLWNSVPATMAIEGSLWLIALVAYARSAEMRGGRRILYWIGAVLITLVWIGNIAGPPPSIPSTAPVASLVLFAVIVTWGYALGRSSNRSA